LILGLSQGVVILLTRRIIPICLFGLVSALSGLRTEAAQPNIILIMADDLGYGDLGCYGSERNPTPHLDAMAKQGMRFTDYHANGAVCSPTRAALLTGRYQQRAGIGGVVTAKSHRDVGMAVTETTLADVLAENGYQTALFGKWHLGYDPKFNPIHQGFGEFIGHVSGNVDYFSHIDQEGYADWWHGDQLTPEAGYVTHLITRHALRFIAQNKDKPFFLYLPHLAPHSPYRGPEDQATRGVKVGGRLKDAKTNNIPETYAAMIAEMDKGMGEIFAALEQHQLTERTLVLFCSDNGANRHGSNSMLRGHKGSIWEGGHRVPMLARWPGIIPAGMISDATVLGMDWFPTLLAAAGIKPPDNLDGLNILPVLRGNAPLGERTTFWSIGTSLAARRGPWKLVQEGKGRPGELYHLGHDPAEKTPVSNPQVQQQLQEALDAWQKSWAAVPQHS
jgi:arylsulfatase A-like enzyme